MLIRAFFQWWYGDGWRDLRAGFGKRIHRTYLAFSVPILLRTMLAPWRRIVSSGAKTLGERMRAVVDNAVSRVVGFTVRLLALVAALVVLCFDIVIGGLLIVAWPVLPPLAVILITLGLLR